MNKMHVSTGWSDQQELRVLQEAARRLGLSGRETPGLDGVEYVKFQFCGYLILVEPSRLPEWCKIALIVNIDGPARPRTSGVEAALRYISKAFNAPIMAEACTPAHRRLYRRYGAEVDGDRVVWRFA